MAYNVFAHTKGEERSIWSSAAVKGNEFGVSRQTYCGVILWVKRTRIYDEKVL
jgi:hypothetical protein